MVMLPYPPEINCDVMSIATSSLNFAPPLALPGAHEGNVVLAINVTETNIFSEIRQCRDPMPSGSKELCV